MRKGVLELCILAIAAEDEVYPGDIIARLKTNDLIVVEGTLYPMLTRLKNDSLLEYNWRESTAGPPRKYFKTTSQGKEVLQALSQSWEQLVHSVQMTLSPSPPPPSTETSPPEPSVFSDYFNEEPQGPPT